MSGSTLMRGTFILSVAIFFTKLIGMLFTIPFYHIVKEHGVYLYSFAYNPYAIILSISTVGVPLAVSKFVAKYNAIGDYQTGRRLFRSGLLLMTLTGFVGFLIMFFGASAIVHLSDVHPEDVDELVFVIRVLSFALIIVPAMSLIRGYFQGFQSMGPTALSQTIEQVVRIGFGLIAAFIVVEVFHGSKVMGVALVTFGAFVGAIAGLIVLIRYWMKRKPHLDKLANNSVVKDRPKLASMYKELISYAIPFVCVGLANQIYLQVDQFTLNHFMKDFHQALSNGDLELIIACLMNLDQKLIMIPVSLSTALALSVVPSVSASYALGDRREMQIKITKALQLTLFLTIPAVVGLSVLSHMIYGLFYDLEGMSIGGEILRWYAPSAILFALFSVSAAILQGINRQKVTILSLGIGILLKLILNPLFIKWFALTGSIWATDIGYFFSILINFVAIRWETLYNYTFIAKRTLLICIFTFIMALGIGVIFFFHGGAVPHTKTQSLVYTILGVIVGGAIFAVLSVFSGLARQVIGDRIPFLRRRARS
ncbi:O-antigen/teichoic acid export membrane protein [Pullulanibacillus pueri]|uniref:Cell division protein n=1 Tax=Pullulanibacillus pueri TaxID=1437324 RepID=A0A8J2ZZ35_9BACL|nr:polysaccharide biosynthesis protein [Pullulanibacillus pueri]MBM7683825.1 O-antigen/teichoic acid export membrane protein [Pullulanibacillus pueri]GGH87763.1 cell division protein [Pullulanibacillus pueri]